MADIEIKYIFDYYEDKDSFTILTKHRDIYSALCAVQDFIRDKYKHSETDTISIEELSDKFSEIIQEHDIDLGL